MLFWFLGLLSIWAFMFGGLYVIVWWARRAGK